MAPLPIVLVHGSGFDRFALRRLGRLISAQRLSPPPVLCARLPGYPAGDVPDGDPIQADVAAVEAQIAGFDQAVGLFGHSYGGRIALEVARRQVAPVARLAVFEPVVMGLLAQPQGGERWSPEASAAFLSVEHGVEPFLERLINYWNGDGAWTALPQAHRAVLLQRGRRVHAEVSALLQTRRPEAYWRAIEIPTLVFRGTHRHPDSQRVCERLSALLPAGSLQGVAGGHEVPVAHPEQIADRLRRLFATTALGPRRGAN